MSVDAIDVAVNPIAALDNISATFSTIAMLKAPLTGIPDRQIKVRGLVRTHLKQMADIDEVEMEGFIDGITELFSTRMTVERLKDFSKKIGEMDRLGKTLERIQDNYAKLSSAERMHYNSIASEVMVKNLEEIGNKISLEAIRTEDTEKFRYLLVSQTIIYTILEHLKKAVGDISAISDELKEKQVSDIISWALFSVVRIEAFRRGKIDLEGLRDTLSLIVAHSTLQYPFPPIALPDDAVPEE
ncbi:MAG TPA: hypothetical protein PLR51_00440 [Methanomassiliicoccales archaeon]|jgi:hypothetical protein|nr:hypothetical protein [Methanomassiliicoccales archaeon]HQQ24728.1 hypothetical protein [Methanomassiliicoccales archaeon]